MDKAGELAIKLVVANGSEEQELTRTVTVKGVNGISIFKDLEFGHNADDAIYGRFFSFETGKMYKDNEIDAGRHPFALANKLYCSLSWLLLNILS